MFTTPTMQRCRNFRVDARVTNFWRPYSSQRHTAEIQRFHGRFSRYKLLVSEKFTTPTLLRCGNFRVDVCTCSVRKFHNDYTTKNKEIPGWTFALQTCSVLNSHNAYTTKNKEISGCTFALQTCSVLNFHSAYTTNRQTCEVDVRVTNL